MTKRISPLISCFIGAPLYLLACGGQADVAEIDREGDSVTEADGGDESSTSASSGGDDSSSSDDSSGSVESSGGDDSDDSSAADEDHVPQATSAMLDEMTNGVASTMASAAAGHDDESSGAGGGPAMEMQDEVMSPQPASSEPRGAMGGGAPAGSSMATMEQADALDAECYDPDLAGKWGYYTPVPSEGCVFSVDGDDEACSAQWECCGHVYSVSFSLQEGPADQTYANLEWTFPPSSDGASAIGAAGPHDGETCPLLGDGAAAVASEGFGYTPAWELAVRDALGTDGEELDPIPLQCMYATSEDDPCTATIYCSEHSYTAGYDAEGELVCARDDMPVNPVSPEFPTFECEEDTAEYGFVPADPCFGPGWSKYFQIASAR